MFTTCPKCHLKLVVTAADLRVAQGYVRCGRCANVFNALAGLSDEQQAVLVGEPRGQEPIPDRALEFDASATDVSEVFVEPSADDDPTGTYESIILRSEDGPADAADVVDVGETAEAGELELELDLDEFVSGARAHAPPGQEAAPEQLAVAGEEAAVSPAPPESPTTTQDDRPSRGQEGEDQDDRPVIGEGERPHDDRNDRPGAGESERPAGGEDDRPDAAGPLPVFDPAAFGVEPVAGSPGRRRALRIGSAALALLLLLQIVHHERSQLADIAWLRRPLTAAYAALGMRLVPHWDVAAYEVRQLGAIAGPRDPGALTVRASVKNTARRAQPLPLLRVVMQDRFGNRIAARDVPPSAYLPAASANRSDLGAGQRVDAEIAFADPGPNAVGFEIDACLRLASGRIACANDAGAPR